MALTLFPLTIKLNHYFCYFWLISNFLALLRPPSAFVYYLHLKMQSILLLRELSAYSNGRHERIRTIGGQMDNGQKGAAEGGTEANGNNVDQQRRDDHTEEESTTANSDGGSGGGGVVTDQTGQLKGNGAPDQTDQKGGTKAEDEADGTPIEVHVYPGTASQKRTEEVGEDEEADDVKEEEEEEKPTSAQLANWRRRQLLPNEVISDICQFMSFAEGNRLYTLNGLFVVLLEPKRKLCLALFLKRVDETRQKLDQTIEEVNERRRHVLQLTEHIGTINARLSEMGDHLANLDAQIVVNHSKLDELQSRIAAMKEPMRNLEK